MFYKIFYYKEIIAKKVRPYSETAAGINGLATVERWKDHESLVLNALQELI